MSLLSGFPLEKIRPWLKNKYVGFGLLCLGSIYFVITSISFYQGEQLIRQGNVAQATIVDIQVTGHKNRSCSFTVEFTSKSGMRVEGKPKLFDSLFFSGGLLEDCQFKKGQELDVHYDSENPQHFVFEEYLDAHYPIGVLSLLFMGFGAVILRRSKKS